MNIIENIHIYIYKLCMYAYAYMMIIYIYIFIIGFMYHVMLEARGGVVGWWGGGDHK